jgi:hypothetical protein
MDDTREHGDRHSTDRRVGAERRTHEDPRGRAARLGPCRECGNETDHVAIWNGHAVRLCPTCSLIIRRGLIAI